jgi:hypothetical protein
MAESHPFPSINIPEKQKDKEYYTKWAKAICTNTFNKNWVTSYNKLSMLYNFYKVGTGSDLTGYLQTAPDGSAMPGIWVSLNSVTTRLDSLVGELEERGYMIKVKALNTEAVSRKLEEKERLRVKRKTQEVRQYVSEVAGIELEEEEQVPQSEEELNEYMDLTWKDKHVMILEAALKWIAHRSDWDETRKALFMDVLIANAMVVRNEIVDGVPQSVRVDLMKFIHDPYCTDDMLSDSTYFGEVDYVPLASVAERYGLTMKELEEAQKSYESYLGMGIEKREDSDFGCMPGQSLKWFKTEDGTPRCLVIKASWRDYKIITHKDEENEKGKFFQDVSYDDKEIGRKRNQDKLVSNTLECWRQATLIGGKFLKEHGECPNQAREINSLQKSQPPYTAWKLNKSLSLLERLVGPQVMKDITLYQLQIQTARAIGKVLIFDEAAMPQGMTKESVTKYIKADGIAWINSKEYQLGSQTNLFQAVDVGLSESIAQSISMIEYYDNQIDQISGVGKEKMGQVQGASTAVGVQQMALGQQSLITAPFFKGFERACSRVHTQQAKLVKLAWTNKSVFSPIIGDLGVDFLRDNYDVDLDEWDAVCQSVPPSSVDRQTLIEWLGLAVQSDPSFLKHAVAIMLEPDNTVAIRKFQRLYAEQEMKQEQMAQQQAEQQMQMQQQQMMLQSQQAQGGWQNQLQLQGMKNQSNKEKTLISSRTKLQSQKIGLLGK